MSPIFATRLNSNTSLDRIEDLLRSFISQQRELIALSKASEKLVSPAEETWTRLIKEFPDASKNDFMSLWEHLSHLTNYRDVVHVTKGSKKLNSLLVEVQRKHSGRYLLYLNGAHNSQLSKNRLSTAILPMLISDFEVLVGELIKFMFEHEPELDIDLEEKFTYNDVASYSEFENFKKAVIEKYITSKMSRLSFPDYLNPLKKISLFSFTQNSIPSWINSLELVESFQRRHLIIHNESKVSTKFLDVMSRRFQDYELPEHDTILHTDHTYLLRTANHLFIAVLSLTTFMLRTCTTEEDLLSNWKSIISDLTLDALLEERYEIAYMIKNIKELYVYTTENLLDDSEQVIKVNGWLAMHELGFVDQMKQEVDEWNAAETENNRMILAKIILLENYEEAHHLAKKLLKNREFENAHWVAWPLFKRLREYDASKNQI